MSATDILNTDMATLARTLRAGVDWWLEELAGMTPPALRRRLSGRPALAAERRSDGGWRLTRDGREVYPSAAERLRPMRATLLLSPDQALVCETNLPRLPDRDLRRLLALEADRLTPFRAEAVHLDLVVLSPSEVSGLQRALVAAVPRATAAKMIAKARAAGLDACALGVAGAPAGIDFLPSIRREEARGGPGAGSWIWGVVALLAVANLLVAVVRDTIETGRLHGAVELQKPKLQETLDLRRQVQAEAARRAAVRLQRGKGEPLGILDALTRAVPDGAWVQRMSWDGRIVRLAGYRQDNVDVVAALRRSPLFVKVRNSSFDMPSHGAEGQPFDITAELAPEASAP